MYCRGHSPLHPFDRAKKVNLSLRSLTDLAFTCSSFDKSISAAASKPPPSSTPFATLPAATSLSSAKSSFAAVIFALICSFSSAQLNCSSPGMVMLIGVTGRAVHATRQRAPAIADKLPRGFGNKVTPPRCVSVVCTAFVVQSRWLCVCPNMRGFCTPDKAPEDADRSYSRVRLGPAERHRGEFEAALPGGEAVISVLDRAVMQVAHTLDARVPAGQQPSPSNRETAVS